MKSVTPPIFMNSLHVFDSVEDYFSVDIFKDEYYYGRASNPTVTILEKKLAALEHGTRAVVFFCRNGCLRRGNPRCMQNRKPCDLYEGKLRTCTASSQ